MSVPWVTDPPLAIQSLDVSPGVGTTATLTDNDLRSMWRTAGEQQGNEVLTIDLGRSARISAVELVLGRRTLDHPRELIIECSEDGVVWQEAWRGRGAAVAVRAAFRDPLVMPLQFPLDGRPARLIRVRQIGHHPSLRWSIAEVHVLGPAR
jgi:hypothetical protein